MPREAPFALTTEARAQLIGLVEKLKRTSGRDSTPGLVWIDANINEARIDSGIGIGFYYDRSEIENDILIIDDIEIVFAVVEGDRDHFLGKTIDFKNGKFAFLGETT